MNKGIEIKVEVPSITQEQFDILPSYIQNIIKDRFGGVCSIPLPEPIHMLRKFSDKIKDGTLPFYNPGRK